ncbi:MAG: type II secretion system protein [Sulfuricurvum sp.]|uniref:type II secretion system protein n=1 Tax=Sulfuricurvum sp. TaxID=2025608 RepID=UPI0026257477|nr:type II secretion system protein [Sulfuricurvum sp.]MDD2828277.1 type II secretion system protein [Sulfuricurvum sp.]MDD4949768.1 type II secretion system protein [Sulfuricurvum sp.]
MKSHRKYRAFTLIELLFVIVVLGIVGGVALEAVRQYYEGIYRTQTYTKRINEADLILEKLSKYFENSIYVSIVNLDQDAADNALVGTCEGDPKFETENVMHDYTVGFLGVDVDSLYGDTTPGWSENAPAAFNGTALTPADANLSIANTIITDYYPASNLANSVIYNHEGVVGACSDFNWDGSNGLGAYYTINNFDGNNTLTLTTHYPVATPKNDQKYLIRSGYALRVLNTGDLTLYTNFRPWKNEKYTSGKTVLLGQNVSSLYADYNNTNSYNERGGVLRLKVCMRGLESNLSTSDEVQQAICRERRVRVRY